MMQVLRKYIFRSLVGAVIAIGVFSCRSQQSSNFVDQLQFDADQQSATVAVLPFESSELPVEKRRYYTDRITDLLVKSRRYRVIERSFVDRILNEQKLQASGLTETELASKIGQLLSAQFVLVGTLYRQPAGVEAFGRLIEVDSSLIVRSGSHFFEETQTVNDQKVSNTQTTQTQTTQTTQTTTQQLTQTVTTVNSDVVVEDAKGEVLNLNAVESAGSILVFGRIQNTGKVSLGKPLVRVGIFDRAGGEIDVVPCFTSFDVLPGKTLPFQCTFLNKAANYASFQLIEFIPKQAYNSTNTFDVTVAQHALDFDGFSWSVRGKLQNSGSNPIRFPSVVITLYDAQGKIIGVAQPYGQNQQLQPGQVTNFRNSFYLGSSRKPARYELSPGAMRN